MLKKMSIFHGSILNSVTKNLGPRPIRIGRKKNGIIKELNQKIPPFTADFDKLRDVILNFVDNAIKYTPSGKVWVTVGTETMPKQLSGHYADQRGTEKTQINADQDDKVSSSRLHDSGIIVRVNDTGMGLDPEDAKKLFDKPACRQAGSRA